MAHAAVTSLITTLGLLLTNPVVKNDKELLQHIESLRGKSCSLQAVLESLDNMNHIHLQHCVTKVKVASHEAEDRIETSIGEVYTMKKLNKKLLTRFLESLLQAYKSLDSVSKELEMCIKMGINESSRQSSECIDLESKESKTGAYERLVQSLRRAFEPKRRKGLKKGDQAKSNSFTSSSVHSPKSLNIDNNVVGREAELEDFVNQLTRASSRELNVVAIVGMGGIGKTTFARKVYNDPTIEAHFEIQAWTTMSKEYHIRKMLVEIFHCIDDTFVERFEKDGRKSDGDLAAELKRKLLRGRYLVVIDDIWSTDAWDDIRQWFPDSRGGQVLLTTRSRNVASYAGPVTSPHQMSPLNPIESWELFQSKLLVKEQLSPELLEIGKRIAFNCQGLPLTIVVIAGLLSKCDDVLDKWQQVEQNIKLAVFEDPHQQCEKVLATSFYGLPQHLKACFLYFGIFPEDSEVNVKRLIEFWIAEGFLKEAADKCLENVAEECVHELIDRNLIFISQYNFCGEVKTCKMHDLLQELCLKEAQSESFLFVFPRSVQDCPVECRRAIVQSNDDKNKYYPFDPTKIRTFICFSRNVFENTITTTNRSFGLTNRDLKLFKVENFSMIRVMSFVNLNLHSSLSYLVHLRYLSLTIINNRALTFISELHNLQSLIVNTTYEGSIVRLGSFTWPRLRNLHFTKTGFACSPLMVSGDMGLAVREKLHTVTGVSPGWCKKEIFASMPNIKKLGVLLRQDDMQDLCYDFSCLPEVQGLETLKIEFHFGSSVASRFNYSSPCHYISPSIFPQSLKKLTLVQSRLSWSNMNIVGMLPNLEALKLKNHACIGDVWKPAAGGFSRLKFLSLHFILFTKWHATDENFPVLERLCIDGCWVLKDIPLEFAYILTLQVIKLDDCTDQLATSARRIPQEQEENLGSIATLVHVSRIRTMDDECSDGDEELNENQASDLSEFGYDTFGDEELNED